MSRPLTPGDLQDQYAVELDEADRTQRENLRELRSRGTIGQTAADAIAGLGKSIAEANQLDPSGNFRARKARPRDFRRLMQANSRRELEPTAHALNLIKRGDEGGEDIGLVLDHFSEVQAQLDARREKGFQWTLNVLIKLTDDQRRLRVFSLILATPHHSRLSATSIPSMRQLEKALDERSHGHSIIVDSARARGFLDDWARIEELVAKGLQDPAKAGAEFNLTPEGLLRLVDDCLSRSHKYPGGSLPSPISEGDPEIVFSFESALAFRAQASHLRVAASRALIASWLRDFVEMSQDRTQYFDRTQKVFYPDPERAQRTRLREGPRTLAEALNGR